MPPPFLTPKKPFCACVVEDISLTLRIRNMWSFISSEQDPVSIILLLWSFCYYGVSVHRGEIVQPIYLSPAHLSPASIKWIKFSNDTWIFFFSVTKQTNLVALQRNVKEDVVHIYNGILLSHKKNAFESVLVRWMNLEPVLQSEVSQKKKNKYSILTHMYGI